MLFRMDFNICFLLIILNSFVYCLHVIKLCKSLASVSTFHLWHFIESTLLYEWQRPLYVAHVAEACLLLECECVNEFEYGYSWKYSHLLALNSFALFITPPAQRQNDSPPDCQLRILDMWSLSLSRYISLSLSLNGRIVNVPAFCLFIKRASSVHAFCVSSVRCVLHVATRSRKRYGPKKNKKKNSQFI